MELKPLRFPPKVADLMVKAITDGRKMAMLVNPFQLPPECAAMSLEGMEHRTVNMPSGKPERKLLAVFADGNGKRHDVRCQYYPGDVLYVQEAWCDPSGTGYPFMYRADMPMHWEPENTETGAAPVDLRAEDYTWRSSTSMPKDAARVFLRVTDVRMEQLRKLTVEDILRTGIDVEPPPICRQDMEPGFPTDKQRAAWEKMNEEQRDAYAKTRATHVYIGWLEYADRLFAHLEKVWDGTVKPADRDRHGYDANPWVEAVTFERITAEEAFR